MSISTPSVAIYCRLSKDDLSFGESSSISTQKMILNKYAQMRHWDIHEIYVDDGWSGTNFERPGFEKMIADIEAGLISIVLVKDLARLGRNHLKLGYYTDMYFPEHKIQFVSVLDEIDTAVATSDLAPIKNFVNEMQALHISQSTKHSLRAKAEAGFFMGSYAPFGYQLRPDNHHKLYIDPKAAKVVKDIYEWCISGDGFTKIARRLNELNIPCPKLLSKG
jgi:site-specific DNA recombinase